MSPSPASCSLGRGPYPPPPPSSHPGRHSAPPALSRISLSSEARHPCPAAALLLPCPLWAVPSLFWLCFPPARGRSTHFVDGQSILCGSLCGRTALTDGHWTTFALRAPTLFTPQCPRSFLSAEEYRPRSLCAASNGSPDGGAGWVAPPVSAPLLLQPCCPVQVPAAPPILASGDPRPSWFSRG